MDDVDTSSDDCTGDCVCAAAAIDSAGLSGTLSEANAQEPFDLREGGCALYAIMESAVASCTSSASLIAICLVSFFDERIGVAQYYFIKDNSF